MPFFDYVAMTRASEKLVVSYPIADRRGRAVGRSRYIGRLEELLGEELVKRNFDAGSRTALEGIGTVDDLLAAVVGWRRSKNQEAGIKKTEETIASRREETLEEDGMAGLYEWVVNARGDEIAAAREMVWGCVGEKDAPRLSEEMARQFYPGGERALRMSVSQLEKFAACPLQYFMHYTLGLRPREVMEMDVLDLGNLYHRILEKVYRRIMDGELKWPDCGAADLRRVLEEEVDLASGELHGELKEPRGGLWEDVGADEEDVGGGDGGAEAAGVCGGYAAGGGGGGFWGERREARSKN